MGKKEWEEWIKCNIVEIIILILVLSLVINTFSKSTPPKIQEKEGVSSMEEQAKEEAPAAQAEQPQEVITPETQPEEVSK